MRPMSAGTRTAVVSAYVADLALDTNVYTNLVSKLILGYNSFKQGENSNRLDQIQSRFTGVANLGRIMNFET
jgi:OOP family OmpA-OmpF porin